MLVDLVKLFPSLTFLPEMVARGWGWEDGPNGASFVGVKVYPPPYQEYLDLMTIVTVTDAAIRRTIEDGYTWEKFGTLADVCAEWLELPEPGIVLAPSRNIARTPLWVPKGVVLG